MIVSSLIVDACMFACIWCVQVLIYPSFTFYSEKDLNRWHDVYTPRMFFVVGPLMIIQLALHGIQVINESSLIAFIGLAMIILNWLITFGKAVGLHQQISRRENPQDAARQLVSINWYRTVLWTSVFLLSYFDYMLT